MSSSMEIDEESDEEKDLEETLELYKKGCKIT